MKKQWTMLITIILLLNLGACRSSTNVETAPTVPTASTQPATSTPGVNPYPHRNYLDIVSVGGVPRWFMMHVPVSYQSDVPTPIVLNFHGGGMNFEQQAAITGMSLKADLSGFIAVYPQGEGEVPGWNISSDLETNQDLQFVEALLDYLSEKINIDPNMIFATGLSNGAGFVATLGCVMADRIAAVAPVSGAYVYWDECDAQRPVPMITFHATGDPVAPYRGGGFDMPSWAGTWAARNGCSPDSIILYDEGDVVAQGWENCTESADVILYTIEDGGHTWPGVIKDSESDRLFATDIIWDFFQSHPMP